MGIINETKQKRMKDNDKTRSVEREEGCKKMRILKRRKKKG
jgi:hypothetical protein